MGNMFFPDHHVYTSADMESAEMAAAYSGADLITVTEKDAVKMLNLSKAEDSKIPLYVLEIEMKFAENGEAQLQEQWEAFFMKIACIIPSRYASTRLPGKPLRMIAGKTLVRRVYERAILAKLPDVVIVATDHKDIEKEVRSFGGDVVMTSANHPTGTDRLAEVAESLPDYDIIVNVQEMSL